MTINVCLVLSYQYSLYMPSGRRGSTAVVPSPAYSGSAGGGIAPLSQVSNLPVKHREEEDDLRAVHILRYAFNKHNTDLEYTQRHWDTHLQIILLQEHPSSLRGRNPVTDRSANCSVDHWYTLANHFADHAAKCSVDCFSRSSCGSFCELYCKLFGESLCGSLIRIYE